MTSEKTWTTVIKPHNKLWEVDFKELWRYRDLFMMYVKRDIITMYKQTIIKKLKDNDILAVFHYLSLHSSPYYQNKHDGRDLPNCDKFADCLVRLPMYYDLTEDDVKLICEII